MRLTVHQSICIHMLRIGAVTNSSIVQIGSSGVIQAKADLYNTGGYSGPAPLIQPADGTVSTQTEDVPPLVPISLR
jgi:spore germination protein PB